jgi:hypothetical protein
MSPSVVHREAVVTHLDSQRTPARAGAVLALTGFLAAVLVPAGPVRGQSPCPNPPPVTLSPTIPGDVCIPAGFPGNPIAFFDDFSWQSFVAVIWPALQGQRGVADSSQTAGGSGARVFETYKALLEVFHNDGSAPSAWNSFDDPKYNPCSAAVGFGDVVLASFSKFSDLGQAGFGSLLGPLVAQNTSYVRYLTAYNQTEFNQIANSQLFLRKNLPASPNVLTFATGSLDVKSAWIVMANVSHPERYYTRKAWVLDLETGACASQLVGLVGLHIVQKTPSRPQWIWSTFEQVDTVPPAQSGAPGTFGFNDGSGAPMPAANKYPLSPLILPTPAPFNVTRTKPIHSSTQTTNTAYQQALKANGGGVWRFYQLVMTQWPLAAGNPSLPGTPNNTFPGQGTDQTSFANTTLETFEQGRIRTGCMNCHNSTMAATDFVWSLNDHAFPPTVPGLMMQQPSIQALRKLLVEAAAPAAPAKVPPTRPAKPPQ